MCSSMTNSMLRAKPGSSGQCHGETGCSPVRSSPVPGMLQNKTQMGDCTLCNSVEGHVHRITHELSEDNNHLKTTYTILKDGKLEKHSICHFDRKL